MTLTDADRNEAWGKVYNAGEDPGPIPNVEPWVSDMIRALYLDGYNTPRARMEPEALIEAADTNCHVMHIEPGDSVFEFATGAGATALALRKLGITVSGGMDLAPHQIDKAGEFMPDLAQAGHLFVGNAVEFQAPFMSDHTIGWGLGMYLDGLAELERVISNMMVGTNPGGTVALVETTTAEYADIEWYQRARDQARFPQPLEHLYPSETQLRRVFKAAGLKRVIIWRQFIDLYQHNNRICICGQMP